ncbi:Uncharacterised protein [Mycolicibacterium vanbaalenii]|uniref:Uncharacterized protein n=1 Tax=Mycolicibacterium vanbaalenii TaxID=110539 RepID=A0A5S9R8J1_MYCVN|nr:Uncharacterised protein [Mycolicibacterium vanbaalenii]
MQGAVTVTVTVAEGPNSDGEGRGPTSDGAETGASAGKG